MLEGLPTKYDIVLNDVLCDGASENGKNTTPCNELSPEDEERGRLKNIVMMDGCSNINKASTEG